MNVDPELKATCPACGTRYRLTLAQLEQRQGLVRCGECRFVFQVDEAVLRALPIPELSGAQKIAAENFDPEPQPFAGFEDRPFLLPVSEFASAPHPNAQSILLPPARPSAGLGVHALVAVLLLALAGQAVYAFRNDLAERWPEARPWLARACEPLGCTVDLVRLPGAVRLESSALETLPGGEVRLLTGFSNRAGQPMPWPHFLLTLKDGENGILARRAIVPADYLPDGSPAEFAPAAEFEMRLRLALDGLRPEGYEIRPVYP